MSDLDECVLCKEAISRVKDKYIVEGRTKESLIFELKSLPFVVNLNCKYICKSCVNILKKRRKLIEQTQEIEERFKSKHFDSATGHSCGCSKRSNPGDNDGTNSDAVSKRSRTLHSEPSEVNTSLYPEVVPVHSTPTKPGMNRANANKLLESPISKCDKEAKKVSESAEVFIRVKWPSKDYTRKLPSELESLGKMLLRGTFKQIAAAAWKNHSLKRELQLQMMKDIDKECSGLCSKKSPSILRSPTKEKLLKFSMEKLNKEIRNRAPLTFSMLAAASVNERSKAKVRKKTEEDFWSPALGVAAAVCLRNRSMYMNAVQLQISMFIYHSSWLVSLT